MSILNRSEWDQSIVGRTLAEDVISEEGHFLLRKDMVLTHWHLNLLKNHDIETIKLSDRKEAPVYVQVQEIFKNKTKLSEQYSENLIEVKEMFYEALSKQPPKLQDFMKPFEPLLINVLKGPDIFLELRQIKGYDEYIYRHSINVGLLSATIGRILRYSNENTIKLGKIGFLHDIGKMKISLQILNKATPLTNNEFKEVKMHTIYGKEILEKMEGTDEAIQFGALCHHERLDGSGYPYGLTKEKIPFLSQIVAVADTYDAISSDRIFKTKSLPFEALDLLVNEVFKGKLNGEIVFPFVQHILNGYIGHEVLLSNGLNGQIIHLFIEEVNRPLVKIGDEFKDLRKDRKIEIVDVLV